MESPAGSGRTVGQFALVSYIPGPLSAFLDDLRRDLTPGCKPRAHVTVLPPRPLDTSVDLPALIQSLRDESRLSNPIEISLGEVEVFPVTDVIYIGIARGEHELHALHENMNFGQLEYDGPYPYHPHVTIAQNLRPDQVKELAEQARRKWAAYTGPRRFTVDCLSFVQNIASNVWLDIEKMPMAAPVGAVK
ncbi:MAG: 2'-5' RNA ligase family protein [Acidobacteriota bacterium]|nr:2'-5' RNA ligase family protein [Acidobacteriota bacterium]